MLWNDALVICASGGWVERLRGSALLHVGGVHAPAVAAAAHRLDDGVRPARASVRRTRLT
jgi:hypothetical protein